MKMPLQKKHYWVSVEKTEVDIQMKSTKTFSPVIKRVQFPLMLALACTVH